MRSVVRFMNEPAVGQRWVSEPEPELGLGLVSACNGRRVRVEFPATGEERVYAWPGAPLRRIVFRPGDHIVLADGSSRRVQKVKSSGRLVIYLTEEGLAREAELSGLMSRNGPWEGLLAGRIESCADFQLRMEALFRQAKLQRSPVRGFTGGRVELIPHQLGIAAEVCSRLSPRALLADEVGLGKTIEAGLILHRLHLTGRAGRVLVLVPEPLIHQWFVELLRRFQLQFSLFDEERCASLELHQEQNPFLDSQLVLCSTSWLGNDAKRSNQAVEAGWQMVIVDEAHHLLPSSPGYELIERLATQAPGLLLLTATPEQLGAEAHFARLRLLDPSRYRDYETFCEEAKSYGQLALELATLEANQGTDHSAQITSLLDRCGIGRVMFRNVRAAISGFPGRKLHAIAMEQGGLPAQLGWLAGFLRSNPGEKCLVICQSAERAEKARELLLAEMNVSVGVFHEHLTLLQRDRTAAWFAEPDGARVLICSEIGSEGRNFQCASNLVLLDLPVVPDLLEQRIGRLDRIGQSRMVHIHVLFTKGTVEEVLFRWYHEGLDAFTGPVAGAARIEKETRPLIDQAAQSLEARQMNKLLEATKKFRLKVAEELAMGYDRLLRWQSRGAGRVQELIDHIRQADGDHSFTRFCIRLLDNLGMEMEELSEKCWHFRAGNPLTESLPALPAEGLTATFQRETALQREDIAFLTPDHPLIRGALDLLLGGERGTAACGLRRDSGESGFLLELCYVMEAPAPPHFFVERFLPSVPVRLVLNEQAEDLSSFQELLDWKLTDADAATAMKAAQLVRPSGILTRAEELLEAQREKITTAALKRMDKALGAEISRLEYLQEQFGTVDQGEVVNMKAHRLALSSAISAARPRMDSVRLILLMP